MSQMTISTRINQGESDIAYKYKTEKDRREAKEAWNAKRTELRKQNRRKASSMTKGWA